MDTTSITHRFLDAWAVRSWNIRQERARPAILNRVVRNQRVSVVDRLSAWKVLNPRTQSFMCLTPFLQLGVPYSDPPRFPLKEDDIDSIHWVLARKLAETGGDVSVEIMRAMDIIERMTEETPDVPLSITISYRQSSPDGTSGSEWASLEGDDYQLSFSAGEHIYAPEVGGDSTCETLYDCNGDGQESGDFDQWLRRWDYIARQPFDLAVSIED